MSSFRGRGSSTSMLAAMRPGFAVITPMRSDNRMRLVDRVGDEHDRLAVGFPQLQQFVLHDLPRLRVKCAEWFIHQQDARANAQRARNADALLHSPGKLTGTVVCKLRQSHQRHRVARSLAAFGGRNADELAAELDVLDRGFPRQEIVLLKDHGPVSARPGHPLTANHDRSRRRQDQAVHRAQQRGFAATRRPQERYEAMVFDRQ